MSVFTKRELESRLANGLIVDSSKIKGIRIWLLGHKIHYQAIVRIWFKELLKSRNSKKLAFMYLACDVVWASIKDCPEFVREFGMYMEKVFKHLVTVNLDEKAIGKIGSFIKIWRKRQIFDKETLGAVEKIWKEGSVDDIVLVKEFKKEKDCIDELPPHLTCSVCSGLLKEPVQLPCCKTALCKLCSFAKLEQHNTCWFGFCQKSVVIHKDDVIISPELAIQVDLWKTQNNERFKENSLFEDIEDKKNLGLLINASVKHERGLKGTDRSSYKENFENTNADSLLQFVNPCGEEKERCTVSAKNSPMRKAMKRRINCDEEDSHIKSQIREQIENDSREVSGIVRISDEACSDETLSNPLKTEWVKVCGDGFKEPITIATENDGTLLLSSVTSQFPGTIGLKYMNRRTNCIHNVRYHNGSFLPPKEGWTGIKFVCVTPNSLMLTKNLVVHGLSPATREDGIKRYFEKFGEVLTVQLIKGINCFALIRFAQKTVESAVISRTHVIDGQLCFSAYSNGNEMDLYQDNTHGTGFVSGITNTDENYGEIFVHQITEALTSDDLRKYFETFGQVLDVHFSEPRKNYAFVQFRDRKVAMSLRNSGHLIQDANVRVGYCVSFGIDAQKAKLHVDTQRAIWKAKL